MKNLKLACLSIWAISGFAAQAQTITLGNNSFEAPYQSVALTGHDNNVTFYYQPTGPEIIWSFGASTGLAPTYSLLTAYDGNWFAFLQGATGILSQSFAVAQSTNAILTFDLALRPGYPAGQVLQILLDDQTLTTIQPTATTWVLETLSLGLLQPGQHMVGFRGLSRTIGDTTAFIDKVQISSVPEPTSLAMIFGGILILGAIVTRRRT